MRLIIEGRLKKNKDTYVAFVEKAFDNVKWYKLYEVLGNIILNYRDRRIIFNVYKKQDAIIRAEDQEMEAKLRKKIRQG